MVNIINADIQAELKNKLGGHLLSVLSSNRSICHKIDKGYAITFRFCNLQKPFEKEDKIYMLLKDDELTVFTDNKSIIAHLNGDKNISGAIALNDFFAALVLEDINAQEVFENKVIALEDELLRGKTPDKDVLKKIVSFKHVVLRIKRYYVQLEMICSILSEDRNGTFPEGLPEKFKMSADKMERLLQNSLHLYDCVVQVREVYQSQIDIEQNNVMKAFTVITTIFFPLTLIAGWYGMNFQMPEYSWDGGYLFVMVISLVIIVLSIILFKIKKWF